MKKFIIALLLGIAIGAAATAVSTPQTATIAGGSQMDPGGGGGGGG